MALARISIVKAILGIDGTDTTHDDMVKYQVQASSRTFESCCGRKLELTSHTEYYSANNNQSRNTIYLKNYPLVSLNSVINDGVSISIGKITVIEGDKLIYSFGCLNTQPYSIKVSYSAGYDVTGWDTTYVSVPVSLSGSFGVPLDIEEVVAEDAAIQILKKRSVDGSLSGLGEGRIGIVKVSRGNRAGTDTTTLDVYESGFTQRWKSVVRKYRSYWVL